MRHIARTLAIPFATLTVAVRALPIWHSVTQLVRCAWLPEPIAAHVAAAGSVCPRCGGTAGRVALLTSHATYYACGGCRHRWSRVMA